ncbi:MAG: hypothetical protein WCE38_25955 [Burkholderiales bacterium]
MHRPGAHARITGKEDESRDWLADVAGRRLAGFLARQVPQSTQVATATHEQLAAALRPGDVLLVEGNTRISVAIKCLTQSTWSHATLYVGAALPKRAARALACVLVEAETAMRRSTGSATTAAAASDRSAG